MAKPTLYSRLSGALDTALTDKYRYNPYTRSTVNIILLQVLLAILTVVVFGVALDLQQRSTVETVGQATQLVLEGRTVGAPLLSESLTQLRYKALQYVLLGIVLLSIFVGYLTARYALLPTKNSLQFQKRFIGNMAHEIRTPLAIIKTQTEVALMDPSLSASMRDTLTTTSEELDRISEILNNLLSFNTLLRPSSIALTEFDLLEKAKEVVERHASLAASRGIELSFSGGGMQKILGNMTGIDQVLTNLVKNALNYTPKHSDCSVTVEVEGDSERAIVRVTDTGIGIAKKDLFYIFQPFYRADTSRVRGVGGGTSGLGLAIVNEIVKAHQGKIFVRSVLNRGTTIEVSFPKVQPEARTETEGEDEIAELSTGSG
jgi:signal transduction histidine kinase